MIVWGIWCGGQVFNDLMTVPIWSASPPESLKIYSELPSKGGAPFFPLFNPLVRSFGNRRGSGSLEVCATIKKVACPFGVNSGRRLHLGGVLSSAARHEHV